MGLEVMSSVCSLGFVGVPEVSERGVTQGVLRVLDFVRRRGGADLCGGHYNVISVWCFTGVVTILSTKYKWEISWGCGKLSLPGAYLTSVSTPPRDKGGEDFLLFGLCWLWSCRMQVQARREIGTRSIFCTSGYECQQQKFTLTGIVFLANQRERWSQQEIITDF